MVAASSSFASQSVADVFCNALAATCQIRALQMLCSLSWMVTELVTSIVSDGSTTANCLMELQESSSLFLTDSEVCFMFI